MASRICVQLRAAGSAGSAIKCNYKLNGLTDKEAGYSYMQEPVMKRNEVF